MKIEKKYMILGDIFGCLINTAHQFELDDWESLRIILAKLIDSTNLSKEDLVKILSESILISQRFNDASDKVATPGQMGSA